MVNGIIVGTFDQDQINDGNVFALGFVHSVNIPSTASTVEIRATGGEEFDSGFWDPDDALPEAVRVHSGFDNWGIGHQSVSAHARRHHRHTARHALFQFDGPVWRSDREYHRSDGDIRQRRLRLKWRKCSQSESEASGPAALLCGTSLHNFG